MSFQTYIPKYCPKCNEVLQRVHRRPQDRLFSLFYPMRRYYCPNPRCCWEGNLPLRRSP